MNLSEMISEVAALRLESKGFWLECQKMLGLDWQDYYFIQVFEETTEQTEQTCKLLTPYGEKTYKFVAQSKSHSPLIAMLSVAWKVLHKKSK
jgi:hypothetical protein